MTLRVSDLTTKGDLGVLNRWAEEIERRLVATKTQSELVNTKATQAPSKALINSRADLNTALPGVVVGTTTTSVIASTLNSVADSPTYGKVLQTALTNNAINPAKPGVLATGNTPFSVTGGFTYTATTSSITWAWTISILRADGTSTVVGGSPQAITGLSAGTTYYFYPYYDDLIASIGWVAGGTGSPAYAQAAVSATLLQQQNLQSRIPLSTGGMAGATPAIGTGGGSGGGGGGGGCFTGNVCIKVPKGLVKFEDLPLNEPFFIINETGAHEARVIVHENYSDHFLEFIPGKFVTAEHGMKYGATWVSAMELFADAPIVMLSNIKVYNLEILSDEEDDKHYILESDDVAHNANKIL